MSDQPQPRRVAEPAAAGSPRRQALAIGAGAVALVGGAATGLLAMLKPKAPTPPAQEIAALELNEAVIGNPGPGQSLPAPSPTPAAPPSPTPSVGVEPESNTVALERLVLEEDPASAVERLARIDTSTDGQRRVLQDPVDEEMPVVGQSYEDSTSPEQNEAAAARAAKITASEAYRAAPGEPTLEGVSPFAPGLKLATTPAWHLARRAAISVSAAIVADVERLGTDAWIDEQLQPEGIDDAHVEAVVANNFGWAKASAAAVVKDSVETFKVSPQVTNSLLMRARFTNRVLAENVIDTLANHVYVATNGKAGLYSGEYDALLRKHAMGRYADLLHALLTHPALLVELDNQVNTKSNPNENLGRELLELYTVGVGNYDETDVRNSALLLTGHTLDWKAYTYKYRPDLHHVGEVRIMEFVDANSDAAEGEALLRRYVDYLAKQPGTAERLARRFAVRFISDEPSAATVAELAAVYLESDTSIPALVKATLRHPDFQGSVGQKWRRPGELINGIARAAQAYDVAPVGRLGGGKESNLGLYGWLIGSGRDLPRQWPVVNGYPDTADYWASTSGVMHLLNATQDAVLGDKTESGVTSWPQALSFAAGDDALAVAKRITWHLTGYQWSDEALAHVAQLLAGNAEPATTVAAKDTDHWGAQAVRLIFASPYAALR